jgi:DNA-binding LacI/PurR family transcriptional regulator
LREFLRGGMILIGGRLPGERELAEALGVGRTALRPALEDLEAEGFLRRQPQSGTFLVAVPPPAIQSARAILIAPFSEPGHAGRSADVTWLHRVVSAFERTARPAGLETVLCDQSPRADDPCSVKDFAHEAVAQGAQAAVLIHAAGTREKIACALSVLHDHGVAPWIVSARTYPGLANQVYFDSGWGAYLAARHLLMHGHRRLGFVGGSAGHEWVQERLAGCRQALAVAEIDDLWTCLPDEGERVPTREDGWGGFREWQALPSDIRPTGLVAANDVVALGLLDAARKAGVAIPEELSLIGFDNDPAALLAGLSTIERPTEALGEAVARALLERLAVAGPESAAITLRLRPVLIPRNTVAPPKESENT